jgi:ankyrin repeat protein
MDADMRASELGVALCEASGQNMIIDVCRLLTEGADVNYVARQMHGGEEINFTPMNLAAAEGHADAVRVLMSRGAEVNKQEPSDRFTALHGAGQEGHLPVMDLLMSKGASFDVRNSLGQTPLHDVAFHGHKEAAIYLLDHVADVNANNTKGFTPLSSAAQEGHSPLVDLLILRGDDLNLASNAGVTPLSMAVDEGRLEVVKLLVEKGAVADQSHNDGVTPMMMADILRLLISSFQLVPASTISMPEECLHCMMLLREVITRLSSSS